MSPADNQDPCRKHVPAVLCAAGHYVRLSFVLVPTVRIQVSRDTCHVTCFLLWLSDSGQNDSHDRSRGTWTHVGHSGNYMYTSVTELHFFQDGAHEFLSCDTRTMVHLHQGNQFQFWPLHVDWAFSYFFCENEILDKSLHAQ